MPARTPSRATEALQQAGRIADSMLYLADAALAAGPDHESAAFFVALRALGEQLGREVESAFTVTPPVPGRLAPA